MTAGMLARDRGALNRPLPGADGAPSAADAPAPPTTRPLEWFRPAKLSTDGRYEPVGRPVYAGSLWWLRPRDRGVRQAAGELARLAKADWVVHCRREPEQYALGWLPEPALKGPPVAFAAARALAMTVRGTFQGVWPVVAHDGATAWWCVRVVDGRVLPEGDRVYRSEAAARSWFDAVPPELTASMTRYAPEVWKLEGAVSEPLPSLLTTRKAPRLEAAQRRNSVHAAPLLRWAAAIGAVAVASQAWQHWTADLSGYTPAASPRPFPITDALPQPTRLADGEARPQTAPAPEPNPVRVVDGGTVEAIVPSAISRTAPPPAGTNLGETGSISPVIAADATAVTGPSAAPQALTPAPFDVAGTQGAVPAWTGATAGPSPPLGGSKPSSVVSTPAAPGTAESPAGMPAPQPAMRPDSVPSRAPSGAVGLVMPNLTSPLVRGGEPAATAPDAAAGAATVVGPSALDRTAVASASAPPPSVALAGCMTALGRTYATVPGWALLEMTCSVSSSGLTAATLYKQGRRGDVDAIRALFNDAAVEFDLASGNARVWRQEALTGPRPHAELWTINELRPRLQTVSARVAIDMSANSHTALADGGNEGQVRSVPVSVKSPLSPHQIGGALDSIPGFRVLTVGRTFSEAGNPAMTGTVSWTIAGATDVRRN